MTTRHTLSVLVENKPGVLARIAGLVVPERVLLLHPGEELHPGLVVALVAGLRLGAQREHQVGDHLAGVAHDRHVGVPVLADLGGVDVLSLIHI